MNLPVLVYLNILSNAPNILSNVEKKWIAQNKQAFSLANWYIVVKIWPKMQERDQSSFLLTTSRLFLTGVSEASVTYITFETASLAHNWTVSFVAAGVSVQWRLAWVTLGSSLVSIIWLSSILCFLLLHFLFLEQTLGIKDKLWDYASARSSTNNSPHMLLGRGLPIWVYRSDYWAFGEWDSYELHTWKIIHGAADEAVYLNTWQHRGPT